MKSLSKQRYTPVIAVLLVLGVVAYVSFFGHLAKIAGKDFCILIAFDPDEAGVLQDLRTMFSSKSFIPVNYVYGTLQNYLALISLFVMKTFATPSEADAIFVLRFLNSLAGIGLFTVLFLIIRSAGLSGYVFLYTLIFLFGSPTFLQYLYNAKPEMLQLFFLTSSLYFLSRATTLHKLSFWGVAGACAGLTFTTKFAGLLLLPLFIWSAALTYLGKRGLGQEKGPGRFFAAVLTCIAGFSLAIAITSPYMLRDASIVWERLSIQTRVNREGFLFKASRDPSKWLLMLFSPDFLGYSGLVLSLLWVKDIFGLMRQGRLSLQGASMSYVFWIFLYTSYLMAEVNELQQRFLLPVIPVVSLFCGIKLHSLGHSENKGWVFRSVALLGLLALFAPNLLRIHDTLGSYLGRERAARVNAGNWLLEQLPPDTRIASDLHTYVPCSFRNHALFTFLDIHGIADFNPDVIVTADEWAGKFADKRHAQDFTTSGGRLEGEAAFMTHFLVYHSLASGTTLNYRILRDFGEVRIYIKDSASIWK